MWYDSRNSADRPYLSFSPDGAFLAITDMNAVGRNDGPRVVVYDLATNPALAFNAPDTDVAAGLYGIRILGGLQFAPDGALLAADVETGRVLKFPPLPLTPSILPSPLNNAGGSAPAADTGGSLGVPLAPGEVNSNSFGADPTEVLATEASE
jgi:hypothetical protein